MKKNLKRTLSFFMSVLMVMTAWVFVAPEKAEAISSGSYPVKVAINVTNKNDKPGEGGSYANVVIYYKDKHGYGDNKSTSININTSGYAGSEGPHTVSTSVSGIPYKVEIKCKSRAWDILAFSASSVTVGSKQVWSGSINVSSNGGLSPGDKSANTGEFNPTAAQATTIVVDSGSSGWDSTNNCLTDCTAPTTGTVTRLINLHCNDQYGVRLPSPNYQAGSNTYKGWDTVGTDTNCDYTGVTISAPTNNSSNTSGTSSGYTVTVKPEARMLKNDSNNKNINERTVKYTTKFSFGGKTATFDLNLKITDPKYKFKYYGNNGTINKSESKEIFYGEKIGSDRPTTFTRTGYTSLGMFKSPSKSDNYELTKPTVGSGDYTDPLTANTVVKENADYYAAWWANSYTVTFEDNRGGTLAEITAKYDKAATYLTDEFNKVPTDPERVAEPGETGSHEYGGFKDYVVVYAEDANGNIITNDPNVWYESYRTYKIKGITKFRAVYNIGDTKEYDVNFLYNGKTVNETELPYGELPTMPADTAKATTNEYKYEFKGWTVQKGDETEVILDKGEDVPLINDFTIRDNITYVGVYERTPIEYTVSFKWKEDGASGVEEKELTKTYNWGDAVTVPAITTDSYYNEGGKTYKFIQWDNGQPITSITAGNAANLSHDKNSITYTAQYDSGTPAVYTVTILDKDGEAVSSETYNHGDSVPTPNDAPTYRDDANTTEYQFDHWVDQFGTVGFSNTALGNRTYTPVFNEVPLYAVNYYNEENFLGTEYYTEGSAIAEPTFEEPVEKKEDMLASAYTFVGWKTGDSWDVKEGDEAVTVMPGETVDLYAKYTPTYKDYTIRFYNDVEDAEGNPTTLISKEIYHYGDKVTVPGDPTKPSDNTYNYTFKGWDKDVVSRCLGSVDYTATYRKSYNYYNVVWLDKDGTKLKSEFYVWNERINTPSQTVEAPAYPGDPTKSYIHDGWKRVTDFTVDKTGEITSWNAAAEGEDFVRGERMTGTIVYKPTFKVVETVYDVTVYNEDGTKEEYKIQATHGEDITEKLSVLYKPFTDDKHYDFDGWLNLDGTAANLVITGDGVCLKPSFTPADHEFDETEYDVVTDSTYFKTGTATIYCECGKEKTIELPVKTDITAPSAVLYVNNKIWDTTGGSGSDANTIRVGQYSQVIVNADDSASGVLTINEYLSKSYIADAATIADGSWRTISYAEFDNDGNVVIGDDGGIKLRDENPNFNSFIRDYDDEITEGDEFYLYYKIVDRKGNVSYINSDKLVYDETAPVITFTGDERVNQKYCLDATFTVAADDDDIQEVTVDGKKIEADDKGVYTVSKTEAGIHQVVATDLAGNRTIENFEIVGKHTGKVYTTNATCTKEGHTVTRCTLCSKEIGERTPIAALGHSFGDPLVIKPTCTKDGSSTSYCYRCGEKKVEVPDELKATGKHKYSDWKVIEEATCSSKGSKIRVCSDCSEVEKAEIPVDPEAHRYYRGVVTKPTCTEDGFITYTCKYDSTHVKIERSEDLKDREDLKATGHKEADEWTVEKEPNCTKAGKKVKYCTKDCVDKDGKKIIMKEQKIPALKHYWDYKETVEATETEEGYDLYVCARTGCGEEDKRETTGKLEKYTVKFLNEDGTVYFEKEVVEGSSITGGEVADPKKAADDTYTYEFSKWINTKDNTKIDLPLTVTGDVTAKAEFDKRYVNYTITLVKEDGKTLVKKIGYKHMGEIVDLPEGPEKQQDATCYYTFAGWTAGADQGVSKSIEIKGDVTLYAVYTANQRAYTVTFADSDNNAVAVLRDVVAGTDVVYDIETKTFSYTSFDEDKVSSAKELTLKDGAVPTKAYDASAHYEFAGWDNDTKNIQEETLAKPLFKAVQHTYDPSGGEVVKKKVYCYEKEVKKLTCSCGSEVEVVTSLPTDHIWGEPDEDRVVKCVNCPATKTDSTTFTVKFIKDDGVTVIKTSYGADISSKVPSNPKKESTPYETFKFIGWAKEKDGEVVTVETIVKADATYYARYESTERYYKVIFAYDGDNVIKVYNNVKAGSSVVYEGDTPVNKEYSDYGHYVFDRWSADTSVILKDTYVTAKFKQVDHDYTNVVSTPATCKHGAGTKYICDCGYFRVVSTGKPHSPDYEQVEYIAPDFEKDGFEKLVCKNCGDTVEKVLPAKQYYIVTITVLDSTKSPVVGARVSLFDGGQFIVDGKTDNNGQVTFKLPEKKKYTIVIDRDDFGSVTGTITINNDGTVDMSGVPQIVVKKCNCTCHETGLWPTIFRFFHKLVKMLTGNFGCCGDPDPRY